MSIPPSRGRPIRRALAIVALAAAAPAWPQVGTTIQALPGADDPAEKLSGALRTLAVSPRDLGALIEAGRDALTLGDPNAAVGFFGRAGEIAPRDGRVKAGLGATLVQLEKPRDALRYFQEAAALGVPDTDLARDRGLAYDLVGDTARAQRDYRTVLAASPDDDAARRRLALSQGIAGDRAGAIATLDPLIRKRDIAAWRAQTFVLAMTGDTAGANAITRVMLPQQQAMLQPFLVRLASLTPADKARAVNFGEMPAAGRSYSDTQLASIGTPATYAPAPVRVAAPIATPVPATPAPVPAAVPAAQTAAVAAPAPAPRPQPATGRERFVSASGVPMRRIEHSAQEQFALGLPRYEYVAIPGAAPRPAEPRPSPARPVAAPTAPTLAAPVVATPTPSAATPAIAPDAAPVAVATAGPPSAPAPPLPDVAMPLGASGAAGHFDLPHEIANRRPVPRAAQPSARPPVVASPRPAAVVPPSPPVRTEESVASRAPPVAAPPAEPAAANPTIATARRARTPAAIELAAVDRPVRRGHTRADPAPTPDTAPADDSAPSDRKSRGARITGEADASADRKGRHGDHAQAADVDAASGRHDRDRAGTGRKRDDADATDAAGAKDRGGKSGRDKTGKADKDAAGKPDRTGTSRDRSGKSGKADRSDKADKPATPKVYVQVAGGANKADMDKAWAGVKAKAPDLMKGRTPSTTPLHATNRLLVGPFKDEDEAQAFVNKLAGKGLSGFTVKSAKGQKVEKIDTGG